MKSTQPALHAWREADRRLQEAGTDATPEMKQEVAEVKRRYRELAAALVAERHAEIDALSGLGNNAVPHNDAFDAIDRDEPRTATG